MFPFIFALAFFCVCVSDIRSVWPKGNTSNTDSDLHSRLLDSALTADLSRNVLFGRDDLVHICA